MGNFGFKISKSRQIDYDKNDLSFYHYLVSQEPSILNCIACGGCTATCTSGSSTSFNFRKLHLLLSRGETQNIKDEISKCMLCGKCTLVCPRGVNTRKIIFAIRRYVHENEFQI